MYSVLRQYKISFRGYVLSINFGKGMCIPGYKRCTKWKTEKNFSTFFLKNRCYRTESYTNKECVYKKEMHKHSTPRKRQGFTFFIRFNGINWEVNERLWR